MRLNFHGELAKIVGLTHIDMKAETVREAIEGFSRQCAVWPRDMPVAVVGYDRPDQFYDSADEVDMMPALLGGGGKFGQIIMGTVTVIVGIIALPSPIGVALIVSGGMMIAQGVVGLFLKAPTMSKNAADPDASKYLGINKNTTAAGTSIIMAWGRNKIAPHWLSLQSDSTNLSYGTFPVTPT